jgi:hypothetical protein
VVAPPGCVGTPVGTPSGPDVAPGAVGTAPLLLHASIKTAVAAMAITLNRCILSSKPSF